MTRNQPCFHALLNNIFVLFAFIFLFTQPLFLKAQEQYPQGYFMFPFNPGKVNYLSGSMGELRSNHFHGGLDVKTAAQIGLPILSSADGYISRIKISPVGYGNVLYITHPNNFVTVYAHLERFNATIAEFVRKRQYEKESFEIELFPGETELQVKKGEMIGISGNTGSSGGPHLHYEIRDKSDRLYNPLMFGFKEVKDNIAPIFEKVVVKTFDIKSRVNKEFGRKEFSCVRQGKSFIIPTKITAKGTLGIELKVHDRMNGTHNMYGISCIEMKLDGKEIYYHNVKKLSFEENKYINAHIDYETFIKKGRRFEKCYIADGNNLSTYGRGLGNGKFVIRDSLPHQLEINIYDGLNNQSTLRFTINGEGNSRTGNTLVKPKKMPEITSDLYENILKIKGYPDSSLKARIFTKFFNVPLVPAYYEDGQAIYLFDLRKGLPDSVRIGGKVKAFNFTSLVPSGQEFVFNHSRCRITFPKDALFDTLYLQYRNILDRTGQESFIINDQTVPLFRAPELTLSPYGNIADTNNVFVYNITKGIKFEGGTWNKNAITFSTRSLGRFAFFKDNVPPTIRYINKVGESVRFNILDRNSGIQSFRATLNGKWLLMNYDPKRNVIWSELPDILPKLEGDLILEVSDRSGNKTIFKKTFL